MAFANGRLPLSTLTTIRPGQRLRADAAGSFQRMNAAFREHFGYDIAVTDSYRDYDGQVRVKRLKGFLAATPGKSNHGWGLALDLGGGINNHTSAQHRWMDANAHLYGWVNPHWAQTWKFEPWHWEYTPHLDNSVGQALTIRPEAQATINVQKIIDALQEGEMFRIRVAEETNGQKNAQGGAVFLGQFGPKGQAGFVHLTPGENEAVDRGGVPLKKIAGRDFSQYERDLMHQAIVSIAKKWSA